MLKGTLEKIIKIKDQVGEEFVAPLVLDYYIMKDSLYRKGYRDEYLDVMSIVKLKSKYLHKNINTNKKW